MYQSRASVMNDDPNLAGDSFPSRSVLYIDVEELDPESLSLQTEPVVELHYERVVLFGAKQIAERPS